MSYRHCSAMPVGQGFEEGAPPTEIAVGMPVSVMRGTLAVRF